MAEKLIAPRELVGVIASHLCKFGFRLRHNSNALDSSSRYLRWPGLPFDLRISDHKAPDRVLRSYPTIIKSVAVRAVPFSETYLLALDFAVRYLARVELRKMRRV